MIVGFKTGPKNWDVGQKIVTEDGAKMCEVWFRSDQMEDYREPLNWLRKNEVKIGLHFWGVCRGNIMPNVATGEAAVRDESMEQIKQTIDFAQEFGCVYVNIHPGAQHLERIKFDPIEFKLVDDKVTTAVEVKKLMMAAAAELSDYASRRGTVLTVETITRQMKHLPSTGDRLDCYDPGNTPLTTLVEMAQQGIRLANDISHTMAALPIDEPNKDNLWQGLWEFTKEVYEQTTLVHINGLAEPFNGTDSHDGVTEADFARGVFPGREQIIQLLSLFAKREKVYIVPEPLEDMPGNYRALAKLALASAEVTT